MKPVPPPATAPGDAPNPAPGALGPRAALVLAATFLLLFGAAWDRLELNIDEGIYLEGARRAAAGEAPYRDFFVLTGPGTFWLLGLVFRLAGATLEAARAVMALEWAVIAACVFAITARLASLRTGLLTAGCFLGFLTLNPNLLLVNHRLDSAALAMLALTAACHLPFAHSRSRAAIAALAGALAAAAAWFTPPVACAGAAIAVWLLSSRQTRSAFAPFLAGGAAIALAGLLLLAVQDALQPMAESLLWSANRYATPNRIPYGAVIGGWSALFEGAAGLSIPGRATLALLLALPALLPPLAMLGAAVVVWRARSGSPAPGQRASLLLILAIPALIASAYPRWDLTHLGYVAAPAYVLAAASAWKFWPARPRLLLRILPAGLCLLAAALMAAWWSRPLPARLDTPAGVLRATEADARLIKAVQSRIRPGDSLFVYPYLPALYFYAGARNPASYSFLMPGMMAPEDESRAIRDLERDPPRWVVQVDARAEAYLRVFPALDPARVQLPHLEAWVADRFQPLARFDHPSAGCRLLELTRAAREPSR